jgi:hypothetical protein
MKKKLNETNVMNELRGSSLFFPQPADEENEVDEVEEAPEPKPRKRATRTKKTTGKDKPAVAETVEAPTPATDMEQADQMENDSPPSSDYAERIETIRKAVKQLGKEATFSRFTQEEKNSLGDVVYTYKRSGIRTSENEVIRIAVNWLLEDFHSDGQNSVLARVLTKLNA